MTEVNPSETENRISRRKATYWLIAVLLTAVYIFMRKSTWIGSTELHTLMEGLSTLLALMVGGMALVRYYSKQNSLFLLVGAGFIGTAFLDGYHAVVTSNYFSAYMPSDNPSLIPWSWIASRLFLSIFMSLSWYAWYAGQSSQNVVWNNEKFVYGFTTIFTLVCFAFFVLAPLPPAYYPDLITHRPEEFVPAIFFLIALIGFLKKGEWKRNYFEHWLIISIIVGFIGQVVFMSFSGQLFDFEFDAAHLLKKISYVCVLIGLLISMYVIFREETTLRSEISDTNQNLLNEISQRELVEAELKESSIKLQKSIEELEQFNYVVSHDLKAPLRAIHNYADFLTEDLAGKLEADQQEYLDALGRAVIECDALINDLLALSKISRADVELTKNVSLSDLIDDLLQSLNLDSNVSIVKGDTWPIIKTHERLLTQALSNIISNAIKFNQSKPKIIKLECTMLGDSVVEIKIEDNGIGIEEKYLDRVMKVFQRLHTREEYEGTGIGLAIVEKAVGHLRGQVKLESQIGVGTCVTVRLPISNKG